MYAMRTGEPSTLSCVLALKLLPGAAASTYVSAADAKLRTSVGGASALPARSITTPASSASTQAWRAKRGCAVCGDVTTAYHLIHLRPPVVSRQENNFVKS